MPGHIRILDPSLSSKIAAGEVIERPASVLKELLENAIDAGATSVSVYLAEGGKRLIRVVDDGEGISREDGPLAFARHATSKISKEDDLDNIVTLGFRGEALSSIAAVARVVLKTKRRGELTGTSVTIEGGGPLRVTDEGCPEGTSIEAGDLFYNLPARLKFQRSNASEFGHALDIFKRIALINPDKRFRLTHGSAKVIDAPPGDLRARIGDIFGPEALDGLLEVDTPQVRGFIGRDQTTSTSKSLYIYVNGRSIGDRSINRAVIDAFGTAIERSRYPFAVLDLKVSPDDVDVNIHPTKSEVRFRNQKLVYDVVKAAVKGALARGIAPHRAERLYAPTAQSPAQASAAMEGGLQWRPPYEPAQAPIDFKDGEDAGAKNPEFLDLEVIGQIWGEFLIAQSDAGRGEFYIIDTHGAAERCAFERLKKEYYSGAARRQMLLLPERVETTPDERDAVEGAMEYLDRLGFEVMAFGPSGKSGGETFLIKAVPQILSARSAAVLIKDLASEISGVGGSVRAQERIENCLMRIACHSVVRGLRILTKEEGKALLRELSGVDFAGHCPHGRPVVKKFNRGEIEAIFKR